MSERERCVIHLGDAGLGRLSCMAKEKIHPILGKNWVWKPENVTCKRCLAIYKKRIRR